MLGMEIRVADKTRGTVSAEHFGRRDDNPENPR